MCAATTGESDTWTVRMPSENVTSRLRGSSSNITPRPGSTPAIANNVAGQTILAQAAGPQRVVPRNPVRLTEISAGSGASQRK